VQYYVPPDSMVNKDFIRDVLAERKKLMKLSAVKSVNVPHFDEISVKSVFPLFKDDPEIMKYIPDFLAAGKLPDRVYFFNILNTVHPEYM